MVRSHLSPLKVLHQGHFCHSPEEETNKISELKFDPQAVMLGIPTWCCNPKSSMTSLLRVMSRVCVSYLLLLCIVSYVMCLCVSYLLLCIVSYVPCLCVSYLLLLCIVSDVTCLCMSYLLLLCIVGDVPCLCVSYLYI